jgi:hypothetical protein
MDSLSRSALEDQVFDAACIRFPQVTERAIRAEILLWSGMNKHKYPDNPEKQMDAMWDAVSAACQKLKAEICGYEVDDLWFYSTPHLRELVAQVCAGIHSTRLDCAYADVERALYRLLDPSSRADIIGWHAGWHEDEEALTEALQALQKVLGGQRPKGLRK